MFRRRVKNAPPTPGESVFDEVIDFRTLPEIELAGMESLTEFDTESGQHIALTDFCCTDITFQPRKRMAVIRFEYREEDDEPDDPLNGRVVLITLENARVSTWRDSGDPARGRPEDFEWDVRGEVDNFGPLQKGVVELSMPNLWITIVASRAWYELQ